MGKLIIAINLIVFFLFFMVQNTADNVTEFRKNRVDDIVHKYVQSARTTGYFTPQAINNMRSELASAFYIPESSIQISCTTTPKYRMDQFDQREMIDYSITIPGNKVIAAAGLLGIQDSNNTYDYVKKGQVASELLTP